MKNLNKNNLVTQANNLVEAKYGLTKNEQLIICAMASFISPEDKDFLTYKTSISEFINILGVDKKSALREMENVIRRLLSRIIKIETPNGWKMYQWVSLAEVNKEEDTLLLRFHDELKPYLLELKKRFTSFKLQEVVLLKSVYAIKIYQLLAEYHNRKKITFEYSLENFREMMLGDKSKKYSDFKNFRVRVLESAQKELNEKSSLSFTFKSIRIGRKIGKIEFQIVETNNNKEEKIKTPVEIKLKSPVDIEKPEIIEKFERLGIKKVSILPFLKRDGEEALKRTLEIFERDKKLGKIRATEQGYIIGLLNLSAGVLTEAERKEEEDKKQRQKEKLTEEQAKKEEEKILLLQKAFMKQKKEEYLANLSEEGLKSLFEEVRENYKNTPFIYNRIKDIKTHSIQNDINNILRSLPNFGEEEATYIEENLKI